MPAPRAQNDSGVPCQIKIFREFLFCLLQNLFFNFLAFPVLNVEFARELRGFDRAIRYQQTQRFFRRGQPAGRIQTRTKAEPDIFRHNRLLYSGDFY